MFFVHFFSEYRMWARPFDKSKRAIIAPNNLIDSYHYKRHKKIRMTEFHSPSLSILIITRSKVSFLIILNYSKMIPRQPRSQGLSSLPPLSLRNLVTCLPESGRFTKCVLGMGGNVGHVDVAKNGISTQLILWPDDHRNNFWRQYFMYYTYGIRRERQKLWSNRSDTTENILALFKFSPEWRSGSTKNANSFRQF